MMPREGDAAFSVVVVAAPDALDQPWISELGGHVRLQAVGATGVALELVRARRPDVLLIDRAPEHAEALLRQATGVAPATAGIAVLAGHNMADVRRLVSAGARDILIKPLRREQLVAALRAAVLRERERPRRVAASSPALQPGARTASPIVLLGSKGGVGTTTLAANLAVALRRVVDDEVALVDLSLQLGDLGVLFKTLPRRTLHAQALAGVPLDQALLDRCLLRHPSGVSLALAPEDPLLCARLDGEHAAQILEALGSRFRWLVADCRARLDGVAAAAVQAAHTLLLVTTPDMLALRDARRAIEHLGRAGAAYQRGAVLLNRCSPQGPGAGEVQRFLGWPVQAMLGDAPAVYGAAAERGAPLASTRPSAPEARRLLLLAAVLAGDATVAAELM